MLHRTFRAAIYSWCAAKCQAFGLNLPCTAASAQTGRFASWQCSLFSRPRETLYVAWETFDALRTEADRQATNRKVSKTDLR